ncbi:MAG: aldo/keto reductase [Actinobacteria bacterium]|nr:aldo/keto reductase [Actinomycetota bacterium]
MTHDAAGTVTLAHGAQMPRIGLGTWPMDDRESERVIADAIAGGYRLIDTAENYGNEKGVGAGVRASGVDRGDLFITTKFNREWHSVAGVSEAFQRSAERLGVDYIDLLLVHWPNTDQDRYVEAWAGLVALLDSGSARAIGVSNFKPAHLARIIEATSVTPDVNQVQLSPLVARREIREFDAAHGIVTQSWSPIGQGNDLLRSPEVLAAAEREGCTPAQAVLAWHLAHGLSVVPKSSDPVRLRENLAAAGIRLSPETMAALDGMDGREAPIDSDEFGH